MPTDADTPYSGTPPRVSRPFAKTEQVLTTMKENDRDRLDSYAAAHEVSRAEAVRGFILDGLKRAELPTGDNA